jgi:hypothetical protein
LNNGEQYKTVDKFDKAFGTLVDLPDATKTQPTTVTSFTPLIGEIQQFTVQTVRHPDMGGDWVFLTYVDATGHVRLVIPPKAVAAIVRQRDSLTTQVRRRIGKASAAARKARGEEPGFMKHKRKKAKAKAKAKQES